MAHDGLEPRLTGARECLEFFGRRVGLIARWWDDELEVDDETMRTLTLVEGQLRGIVKRCRHLDATTHEADLEFVECSAQRMLLRMAEKLRSAIAPSRLRPEPLRELIGWADEIEATYRWWNAVSSGKCALFDDPPPLRFKWHELFGGEPL